MISKTNCVPWKLFLHASLDCYTRNPRSSFTTLSPLCCTIMQVATSSWNAGCHLRYLCQIKKKELKIRSALLFHGKTPPLKSQACFALQHIAIHRPLWWRRKRKEPNYKYNIIIKHDTYVLILVLIAFTPPSILFMYFHWAESYLNMSFHFFVPFQFTCTSYPKHSICN